MKNKKLKLMAGAFIFIFVAVTLMWQLPKVFAAETWVPNYYNPYVISENLITWSSFNFVVSCDPTKFHIDVNGGGVNPLNPTSCNLNNGSLELTFAGTPWPAVEGEYQDLNNPFVSAENGMYMDSGAVTDSNGNTNVVIAHDASFAINDLRAPWMTAVVKNSNTSVSVIMSRRGFMGGGDFCAGFTFADAVNPLSTYAIGPCDFDYNKTITFTVADISPSIANGINITYNPLTGQLNGTWTGNLLDPGDVGITLASWSPPAMSSVVANSNTQLTVTLNKEVTAGTITKSNDGGFVVTETGGTDTYAVTAVAPGATNAKAVLTVADMSASAAVGVTVTYTAAAPDGNGTVADANSVVMATDATGVAAVEFVPPTMSSAVKDTVTQITVTLSELATANTITKSNDGGFVVTQTGALTTFAVSAVAPGATNDKAVLTVADMTAAESAGVTVTYVNWLDSNGNGRVADAVGNELATNSTGLVIAAWSVGRRSFPTTTTTDTSTGSDATGQVVIPTPTVTATYGETAATTVSAEGTTAAMSFGSAVSFPVNGAAVSVTFSSLPNQAAGTASVVIEVGGVSSARLVNQRLKAQGLKLDLDLKVGEPQQVDIDGDGIMDLEVKLEEIISTTDVKITMKTLKAATVDETVQEPKVIKNYTDGKWVKDLNHPAVYFIDTTNVRHIYLTKSIWSSYFGNDFSKVTIVPTLEILGYTVGESVPFKSGSLIKTPTSPKVYKVDVDGTLQWIVNETVAYGIVGPGWQKNVVDVSETVLGEFKMGSDLIGLLID